MDCDAMQRCDDVLAGEGAGLAQGLDRAVHQEGRIRQLSAALASIDEQRSDATIHVDQVVGACRTRLE